MADDLYYGDAALGKRLFAATAIVTAPVIFSTAAGTGGPLLWNGSTDTVGRLIGVSYAVTTASAVAGALGWTGGTGQTAAPSSTTAIDSVQNHYIGGPKPKITAYRVGTVSSAGGAFAVLGEVPTTAITALAQGPMWIPLRRSIVIPPSGGWWSIAASATLTSAVLQVTVVWEEIYAQVAM